jgi:TPR repeat protein
MTTIRGFYISAALVAVTLAAFSRPVFAQSALAGESSCPEVAAQTEAAAPASPAVLEKQASGGDVTAALNLAKDYESRKEFPAAEKWYRFALYKGNGRGALGLYGLHERGALGLDDADHIRQYGLNLIEEDAQKGNGGSAMTLATFYLYGENVKADYAQAKKWFEIAEEDGKPMASYFLGMLYSNGLSYDTQPRVAFHYFEKAAAAGVALATRQVAIAYHTGIGAPRDLDAAIVCYTRSAGQGDMLAMRDLGNIYRLERKDMAQSEVWFQKAAALGDLDSHYILGKMYENSRPAEAKKHFEAAAKFKHHLSRIEVDPTYVPHE